MLFGKGSAACLLALFGLSTALPSPSNTIDKRDAVSGVTIFAYGSNINGKPVFYSDGKAFIGTSAPPGSSNSVNVTFSTADGASPDEMWSISANTTNNSNDTAPFSDNALSFYIVPTNGTFEQAGFTSSNDSLPTGGVTEGFVLYGKEVAYQGSASDLELQFWAAATNETDVWGLYWNSDASSIDGAFPVVLKTTAPIAA